MINKFILFSLIIIVLTSIAWGGFYYFFNRVRKAYKTLRQQVGQNQQLIEGIQHQLEQIRHQMQQEAEQVQQQMETIKQHLLLEHMADVAARAKEMGLIDSKALNKSVQVLHTLEMDNLRGMQSDDAEKER